MGFIAQRILNILYNKAVYYVGLAINYLIKVTSVSQRSAFRLILPQLNAVPAAQMSISGISGSPAKVEGG